MKKIFSIALLLVSTFSYGQSLPELNLPKIPKKLADAFNKANISPDLNYPVYFNSHKICDGNSIFVGHNIYIESPKYNSYNIFANDYLSEWSDNNYITEPTKEFIKEIASNVDYYYVYLNDTESIESKVLVNKISNKDMVENHYYDKNTSFLSKSLHENDVNKDFNLDCTSKVNFKELDKIIVDFIDINGNDNPKSKKNFKTAKEAVTWYKEILREIQKKNPIVETRYTQREHIYNSTTAWVDQNKSMAYKVLLHMEPEYYYVETFKFKYSIE